MAERSFGERNPQHTRTQAHENMVWNDAYTALHASGPPERLPWESVPKQITLRQVHEHGGAPTETGEGLTEETSQWHQV